MLRSRLWLATLALATVGTALVLTQGDRGATVRAQDAPEPVELFVGCNNVTLTFPTGTPMDVVTQSITPISGIRAIWRYDNALQAFQGYSPEFPQASDLTFARLLDAVFICMDVPGVYLRPALPSGTATATSTSTGTPLPSLTPPTTSTPTTTSTVAPTGTVAPTATMAPTGTPEPTVTVAPTGTVSP